MKQVFITGASKGLGKALAEAHLKLGDFVVGISRTSEITHEHYEHIQLDLTDFSLLKFFNFNFMPHVSDLVLYNNAGTLGEIKYLGEWTLEKIEQTTKLNVVVPLYLNNQFVKESCNAHQKKYVLNIGSGAGERPIDGWGQYCSSKAALHMASRVFEEELNRQSTVLVKQRTISPGVIRTNMQVEIRKSDEKHFSQLPKFKSLHSSDSLQAPEKVADKIIRNFDNLFNQEESIQILSNYS